MDLYKIIWNGDSTVGTFTSSPNPLGDFEYSITPPYGTTPPCLEEEACEVLSKTGSLDEIRLIYSYIPFQDLQTPCNVLSKRQTPFLDAFLNILHRRKSKILNQDNKKKAEEILSLLGPRQPPSTSLTWDWEWTPIIIASSTDAARVAEAIDFKVCSMFCKIPFWAWVKAWLGCEDALVANFIRGVCNMRDQLYRYVGELRQLKHMYELVEEELRCRHPSAHWIVSSSLQGLVCPDGSSNPYETLGFLFHPISALFRGHSLVQTVQKLEVLAVRFADKVLDAEQVNWESPFATDFSFLNSIRHVDPETLATSITSNDLAEFSSLSPKEFHLPDRTSLQKVGEQWNTLADDVKSCVIADSDLIQSLSKLAVHLFGLWNYYSATAVLTGLNNAKNSSSKLLILPDLIDMESNLLIFWNVISTENNYQCYRELWLRNPGLPFLFPHCSELRRASSPGSTSNPGRIIGEIFAFASTLEWKNERRRPIVDDLDEYVNRKKVIAQMRCLPCRNTRRKCDKRRPTCQTCETRHLECEYLESGAQTKFSNKALVRLQELADSNSYPSRDEKLKLVAQTRLTEGQVTKWFNNTRRRKKGSVPCVGSVDAERVESNGQTVPHAMTPKE